MHSFCKYYLDIKNFHNLSLESNHSFLAKLLDDLDKSNKLKT